MKITQQKWYLWLECLAIYIGLPTFAVVADVPRSTLFVFLYVVSIWAVIVLWRSPTYSKRRLWSLKSINGRSMSDVMMFFIPSLLMLLFYTYYFYPNLWFGLPRDALEVWIMVMIGYPILSVYPQELIYRGLFFRRYHSLFSHDISLIAASAVAFGYMHIILLNANAVILSTIGGIFFAYHYHKYRSVLLSSIEHSLYGCFIFTVGLGWFFYTGAVR